jgi:glycosyltransferase involved in cell wall biosynthesis
VRICILAAGAAGMYCGSCLRDNALATALLRGGHDVTLVPLYTPMRTDVPSPAITEVFFGGINSYLQHASSLFRHTPRALDWLLDRPWLLNMAGAYGSQTSPAKLGPFILSMLQGEQGPQVKELRRLASFIRSDVRPEVVSLPNLMFIGMARMLGREVGAPVVCELTGEDIFLDAMAEPYRSEAQRIIRDRAGDIAKFVATSDYYAKHMAEYLGVDRARIDVVHPGIPREILREGEMSSDKANHAATVGYFARICPEKGLDRLVEAFALLRRMEGTTKTRLRAAGYMGKAHEKWFANLRQQMQRDGLADGFEHVGEVDLAGKLAFLDSIDVLSVPAPYPDPKGTYVLEAMARGVPVLQPRHGAFTELIELTGGGVLVPPGDAQSLADAIVALLRDAPRRRELGQIGRQSVRTGFTDDHMAAKMLGVFQGVQP